MVDQFGRTLDKLRLSVTDRCMYRCVYCKREKEEKSAREALLSFDETVRLITIFSRLGITKLRITGGEPLQRKELPLLLKKLSLLQKWEAFGLTTNGFFLEDRAEALKEAGLTSLNVSLDSLNREAYKKLAGQDGLARVLRGIRKAKELDLPVKVNAVILRGVNDQEILAFLRWARKEGVFLRFIECFPVQGVSWEMKNIVTEKEIVEKASLLGTVEKKGFSNPATIYEIENNKFSFGVIPVVSRPFCSSCQRVRVTAKGMLYSCLYARSGLNLKDYLQFSCSDEEILEAIAAFLFLKPKERTSFITPVAMSALGG